MRIGFVVINVTSLFLHLAFVALVSAKRYADVKELQIGVKYKPEICKVRAQKGDSVSVEYVGKLTDGTVYDSSIEKGYPIEFRVGFGHVVDGWDQGVTGMCLGEKRKLKIPPKLGYGREGSSSNVPGGATLILDIELVGVNGKTLDNVKSDDKEL